MTIKTTSTARTYHPAIRSERQVRLALDGKWRWREVDEGLNVLREGTCDAVDVSAPAAAAATDRPALWVRWPL